MRHTGHARSAATARMRVKVAVHGIPTLKVGDQVMAEARSVGLQPTLEQVSP